MAPRASLPGELFLDAIVSFPARAMEVLGRGGNDQDWARIVPFDDVTVARVKKRRPYVALRWVLNPALGIPLEPFTVWRRPAAQREPAQPIKGWHRSGFDTWGWDGVTEMLRIELDLTGPVTAKGLGRAELAPVQTVSGTAGETIVLDRGPMLAVQLDAPGSVAAVRCLSTVLMANGGGWKPFERVGLPFGPGLVGATYYQGAQQGPVSALTDPIAAAVKRLENWGPVLGWAPLAGLPPWQPPDPRLLVKEMQRDVLPDLAQVMTANPPPQVARQVAAEVTHKLDQLRQIVGTRLHTLNGGGADDASHVTVRPLQSVTTSVATDTWASLALGFGTGDLLADDAAKGGYDYMVTAPWRGTLSVPVRDAWPWPWLTPQPPPEYASQEVERELAAIVLAPDLRTPPAAPTPVTPELAFEEGADTVDQPYHTGVLIRTTRPPALPRQPRASAYGLARFDGAGTGAYALREHPLAKGWIPIGSAQPVRPPEDPPDPTLVPGTVMLRDSGVPRPISGPPNTFQYALAATDLFGQWGPWAPAWFSLDAAAAQAPVLSAVRARAVPGAGDADPCSLTVTAEVVWNIRERSLRQIRLAVDIRPPTPAPPAPYDEPPGSPQGGTITAADLFLSFATDGTPGPPPAGVTITGVHDDDTPVTPLDPADGDERRYRIVVDDLAVTYGGHPELAIALYAQAEETIRPGEWSGWAHAREIAIAANPLPPPAPTPLPLAYPDRASLPDAAGLSYAPVTWTPTGAWRYRVYTATEAALLAACGRPGPTLTQGFTERMQALFDLYKDMGNREKLKSAFRKLGTDPMLPLTQADGTMRFESLLPRGSSLIHCYVVAGVSEANVISSWPQPDVDGRKAFLAYAIPRPLRPAQPEVRAFLNGSGTPQVSVRVGGAVPATSLRLYRATNAILARQTGTMELISTIPTDPASWQTTTITDPTAPVGWAHLQYRAVAVTDDDPEHGGMAVPSEASRSYALLNPPPNAPALTLTPNLVGSTAALSLVRVDTDALQRGSDIGDFSIAGTVTAAGVAPMRFRSSLGTVPAFASTAVFTGSSEPAGYVGGVLYLRLARIPGQQLGLAVDVTDPLDRSTHAVIDVPAYTPDPPPTVTLLTTRIAKIIWLDIDTNVTLPPDPARDWQLRITSERILMFPPSPPSTTTFAISGIETISTAADMPNPASRPDQYAIRRIDGTGRILLWARSAVALRIAVTLTNSDGISASAQQVTP